MIGRICRVGERQKKSKFCLIVAPLTVQKRSNISVFALYFVISSSLFEATWACSSRTKRGTNSLCVCFRSRAHNFHTFFFSSSACFVVVAVLFCFHMFFEYLAKTPFSRSKVFTERNLNVI